MTEISGPPRDRRRVAAAPDAGAILGSSQARHRAAVQRAVSRCQGRRHVSLRRLRQSAVRQRHEVRIRHGMAEFHRSAPRRREDDRGPLLRHGAHGSAVRPLRRPSRPRLPGRPPRSRRDAVLHERLCPRPRETEKPIHSAGTHTHDDDDDCTQPQRPSHRKHTRKSTGERDVPA